MWDRLLDLLPIGCRHRHLSQPFSAATRKKAVGSEDWDPVSSQSSDMYVVCLDCGRHFGYDWSNMRVMK